MSMDSAQETQKKSRYGTIWPKHSEGITFGANDFLRLKDHPDNQMEPDGALQIGASCILRLSAGDNAFASRVRAVFDAIPQKALEIEAGTTDLKAFREALKISLGLVVYAAVGGRRDLQPIIRILHMGVLAVDERLRGVDEPVLRANYSPNGPRDDDYVKCVKTWCAMAGHALVAMGVPRKEAAKSVANVVNTHEFLPIKRSGKSVVPRSIVNWMVSWDNGDLKFLGDAATQFREAFDILDQSRANAAQRKLLQILVDRLHERKSFQLYPKETSPMT